MSQRPRQRIWILTLLVILTSSCSFGYIYRQLDWLIPWYVSDYITLHDYQQSELERRLVAQLEWHCSTQLNRYAAWFRQLDSEKVPFSRDRLNDHYRKVQQFWGALMANTASNATPLLSSATDAQLKELMQNLEYKNRELEERFASMNGDEIVEQRIERMSSQLERWLGGLQPGQQAMVDEWAVSLGAEGVEPWMENRRRWQGRLNKLLEQRNDSDLFEARLTLLLVEPERVWSDEYRQGFYKRLNLTLDLLASVAAEMNAEQKEYLSRELKRWAGQFDSLACSAKAVDVKN